MAEVVLETSVQKMNIRVPSSHGLWGYVYSLGHVMVWAYLHPRVCLAGASSTALKSILRFQSVGHRLTILSRSLSFFRRKRLDIKHDGSVSKINRVVFAVGICHRKDISVCNRQVPSFSM